MILKKLLIIKRSRGKMAIVLIVEDSAELASVIKEELEAYAYHVFIARDGHQALQLYQEILPDVIILDWMMPELDGLDILRRLRQITITPILMLTAQREERDCVLSLEVGADDYVTKPFSMRELVARIRALLRRIENIQQSVTTERDRNSQIVIYGPLVLDPLAHTITLHSKAIELSPTEFDIVHLLLSHPGRTFSRAYVQETIWKHAYMGGDRSIDNAMLRIRRKLVPLRDTIETVRGIGYRLRREWQV
jgi:DNA-binding response OmpR family regulator